MSSEHGCWWVSWGEPVETEKRPQSYQIRNIITLLYRRSQNEQPFRCTSAWRVIYIWMWHESEHWQYPLRPGVLWETMQQLWSDESPGAADVTESQFSISSMKAWIPTVPAAAAELAGIFSWQPLLPINTSQSLSMCSFMSKVYQSLWLQY